MGKPPAVVGMRRKRNQLIKYFRYAFARCAFARNEGMNRKSAGSLFSALSGGITFATLFLS